METSGKASAGLSSSSVGGSANLSLGLSLSGSAGASASASAGGGAYGQASASSEGKRLTLPLDIGLNKQSYDVLGTAVLGPQIEVKGSGSGGVGGSFAASDVSGGSAAAGASVSASAGLDPAAGSVKAKGKGFSLPFGKKKSYPVTGEGGHGELSAGAAGAVSPPSIGASGSASASLPHGELSAAAAVEPSKAKKQKTSFFGSKGKKSPEVTGAASAEAAIEVPHVDFPEKNGRAEVGAGVRSGAELHGAAGVGASMPKASGTLSGRGEGGLSSPSGTLEAGMEVDAHGKKPRVGGKVSLGEQSRAFALKITSPFTKLGAKFGVAETVPPSGKGAASGAGGSAGFSAGAGVGLSAGGKRRGSRSSSSSSSSSSSDDGGGKAKGDKKKKKAQLSSPSAGLSGNVGVDVSAPELEFDASGKGSSMELSLGAGAHKSKSGASKTLSPPSPAANVQVSPLRVTDAHVDTVAGLELPSGQLELDVGSRAASKGRLLTPGASLAGPRVSGGVGGGADAGFSLKGPSVEAGELNFDAGLVAGTKPVQGGVSVSMPQSKAKGKVKGKGDVDFGVDVSGSPPHVDLKGGDAVDVDVPGIDLDAGGKAKGGARFRMPKMPKMPKFRASAPPDGGSLKADAGAHGPRMSVGVDAHAPETELDIHAGSLKVDAGSGTKAKATLKGPDVKLVAPAVPSVEVGAKGDASLDINFPHGEVDADFDGKAHKKGGFKMPKFKLPHFGGGSSSSPPSGGVAVDVDVGMKTPKTKGELKVDQPDVDVSLKGPKIAGSVKAGLPEGDLSLKGPKAGGEVDVSLPQADVELDAEGKPIKGSFGITMPKAKGLDIHLPHVHMPSLKGKAKGDVDLPEGDLTIAAPSAGINVKSGADVDLPDAEVELDVEGKPKKGGFKMPKFKMPHFGGSAGTPSADINVKGGTDVNLPDAEIELDVDGKPKKGGFKMPKFKMPHFGGSAGAEAPAPGADLDIDISVKAPKVKGDVKVDLPEGDLSVKGPKIKGDAKVDLPEGEVELDAEGKPIKAGFGIKMPKFKGPDFHLPSFKGKAKGDVDLPEGDVTIAAPSADISVKGGADVDLPDAEVELDVDGKPKKGGFKMPKFKMPGFGVSAGTGSPSGGAELDADISVKKPKVKGDLPEGELSVKGPKIKGDVKVDLPEGDLSVKGPKIKGDAKGELLFSDSADLHVKGDANVYLANRGFSVSPLNVKGGLQLDTPEVDISVKVPQSDSDFKVDPVLPSFGVPKGDVSAEGYLPQVGVQVDHHGNRVRDGTDSMVQKGASGAIHFPSKKGPAVECESKLTTSGDIGGKELEFGAKGAVSTKAAAAVPKQAPPQLPSAAVGASASPEFGIGLSVKPAKSKADAHDKGGSGGLFGIKLPSFSGALDAKVSLKGGNIEVPIMKAAAKLFSSAPDAEPGLSADPGTAAYDGTTNSSSSSGGVGYVPSDIEAEIADLVSSYNASLPTCPTYPVTEAEKPVFIGHRATAVDGDLTPAADDRYAPVVESVRPQLQLSTPTLSVRSGINGGLDAEPAAVACTAAVASSQLASPLLPVVECEKPSIYRARPAIGEDRADAAAPSADIGTSASASTTISTRPSVLSVSVPARVDGSARSRPSKQGHALFQIVHSPVSPTVPAASGNDAADSATKKLLVASSTKGLPHDNAS